MGDYIGMEICWQRLGNSGTEGQENKLCIWFGLVFAFSQIHTMLRAGGLRRPNGVLVIELGLTTSKTSILPAALLSLRPPCFAFGKPRFIPSTTWSQSTEDPQNVAE